MSTVRWLLPVLSSLCVGGCGLYVPEIQENPFDRTHGVDFVQAITENVKCEVQDSVNELYDRQDAVDPQHRILQFLDDWGVEIALTLTTDEKGSLNPVISWLPTGTPSTPSSIFSLNLGAALSSDAQRVDKISTFFSVAELRALRACPPGRRQGGVFLLESDLKLGQWLTDTMISINNNITPVPPDASGPLKTNVLSHEVKFDIVSSGTLTPAWKLRQSTINQTGNFLTGSRDRTQDLIVTFGPLDPKSMIVFEDPITKKKTRRATGLATPAANSLLASEIGNAVSNGVRAALQP